MDGSKRSTNRLKRAKIGVLETNVNRVQRIFLCVSCLFFLRVGNSYFAVLNIEITV